ncbi:MAG: exopolyphosphatase [Rhodobiaceae bacterium]|nr:MAG: exopolyphosphatase [Rhodobiaceae bacterium]
MTSLLQKVTSILRKKPAASKRGDPVRTLSAERLGIIDIGSNSVRLVIYESEKRNPVPLFNEKVLAGLGSRLNETGKLDPDGRRRALAALKRFTALLVQLKVDQVDVVATAAVRDAEDGAEFKAAVEKTIGRPVRLLAGEEEATYAALGVLSGIPAADGIVGDLGGGSLELIEVAGGVLGERVTLPLGPLRLLGNSDQSPTHIRAEIDQALAGVNWLDRGRGRSLYAVGGVWRNLARIHMAQHGYPVRVLQNYVMPAAEVVDLAELMERLGPKSLAKMPDVSSRRVGALPMGARVLSQLIEATQVKEIVVSAYGLREGLLFDKLSTDEKKRDPLVSGAEDLAHRLVRFPEHRQELVDWTAPLFLKDGLVETAKQKRLRDVACVLADIGWYVHPDYRAAHALEQILLAPLSGVTHPERLYLARVGYHRHEGAGEPAALGDLQGILEEEEQQRARVMGLALRLAFTLCAASMGVLPHTCLVVTSDRLFLDVPQTHQDFVGEVVEKRLAALAKVLGLKHGVRVL